MEEEACLEYMRSLLRDNELFKIYVTVRLPEQKPHGVFVCIVTYYPFIPCFSWLLAETHQLSTLHDSAVAVPHIGFEQTAQPQLHAWFP